MHRSNLYRPQGVLEYLVHLPTGNILTASPFMRTDTFNYRNEKLKHKNLKWLVHPEKIRECVKIPGGKLSPNSHIWFHIKNLKWNKEQKILYSDELRYFDGISNHTIKITGKTEEVKIFDNCTYVNVFIDDVKYFVLIWKCEDIRFIFAGNHSNINTDIPKIIQHLK